MIELLPSRTAWRIVTGGYVYKDVASGRTKTMYTHDLVGGDGKVRDSQHWDYPVPPDRMLHFLNKVNSNLKNKKEASHDV